MKKRYGSYYLHTSKIPPNKKLESSMHLNMRRSPHVLDKPQRIQVDLSVRELCNIRAFNLLGLNVRTDHLHAVISAASKPERIITDLKAYTTRSLIKNYLIVNGDRVWSRGGSRRYLWKQRHVDLAVDYVLYGQGKLDFE